MTLNIGSLKRSKNTANLIADVLRDAIMQGKLKSKQPLRQDEIAAEFGVSKIPVREALFLLEAEGLVTFYPNRGAIVSALSSTEADEIYTIRISLETLVLRRAIPCLNSADIVRAEGVLNAIDHESEPFKWGKLNWEFHAILYQPARMPRLMEIVRTLHLNVARYFPVYHAMEYRTISQGEHRDILEACRQKNADQACTHLEHHLNTAAEALVRYLEQQP